MGVAGGAGLMSDSQRGFFAKLGAIATAPVLTAFVNDEVMGLAVPDRNIATAKDIPEAMLLSSTLLANTHWLPDDMIPDRLLPIYVDGKRFLIQVFRG